MKVQNQKGFTIVELLIVIVVIAILASITIVSYAGITRRAGEAAVQSDVSSMSKAVEAYKILNSSYPATLTEAGVQSDPGKTVFYSVSPNTGYCLSITKDNIAYKANSSNPQPTAGNCGVSGEVGAFVGNASTGLTNGDGTNARFSYPSGMAFDASNTLYVADQGNNMIRKVSPSGSVSTYAGSGTAGSANGMGASAQFRSPLDVVVDSQGNAYVADFDNNQVRRILPSGEVQNFASLSGVTAVAVNPQGGLYAARGSAISKVTTSGVVQAWIASTITQCRSIYDLAVASNGDIYAASTNQHAICKITPEGTQTVFAGSGSSAGSGYVDDVGTNARFNGPSGLAFDSQGILYVADSNNQLIRKVDSTGRVSTVAGSVGNAGYANGSGASARFNNPWGIAINSADELFVSDTSSIRKVQ